ncbi:hypothetical protein BH18ACI4_BH18ACI4_29560 [soil metagenome]
MSATDQTVQVTVTLPKDVYQRVEQAAVYERRQLEDLLSALVAEGLDAHTTLRELFENVSAQYRARLDSEGRLDRPSNEVLQELRDLREQVARELYP